MTDGVYELPLKLCLRDVDMNRKLRVSRLFEYLQEISIAQTEDMGMGRSKTLDRGFLWVLTRQHAKIERMPEYDERVVLRSWPGRTMHVLFPRYYTVSAENGEPLIAASSYWTLMSEKTRTLAMPEEHGVVIEETKLPAPIELPRVQKPLPETERFSFTVPYSFTDFNGHMNNTRYFDIVQDHIPDVAAGHALRYVSAEYSSEVRFGETMTVSLGNAGNAWSAVGEREKHLFRVYFDYETAKP